MTVKFTAEERQKWTDFCLQVAFEIGEDTTTYRKQLDEMSDSELDVEADYMYELSGK